MRAGKGIVIFVKGSVAGLFESVGIALYIPGEPFAVDYAVDQP